MGSTRGQGESCFSCSFGRARGARQGWVVAALAGGGNLGRQSTQVRSLRHKDRKREQGQGHIGTQLPSRQSLQEGGGARSAFQEANQQQSKW